MRRIIPVVLIVAVSGCVWPPDPHTLTAPLDLVSFDVHKTTNRWLNGSDHVTTIVTPDYADYYFYGGTTDTARYIIVNGDTAYRHLGDYSPTYNTNVIYHTDGSPNTIIIVCGETSHTLITQEN